MTTLIDGPLAAHVARLAGVRVGAMLWGGLAVVDLTRSLPATAQLGTLVVLAALCSQRVSRGAGLLVAGTGWLVADGFVLDSQGALAWHGSVDVLLLVVLLAVTLVAGGRR